MVGSVNACLLRWKKPFLFGQIPFIEVAAAAKNQELVFEWQNKPQPAMQFWLQPGMGPE
ncbi:Exodeoxyribonuclease V beta chain [Serratia fonticola]|uniref:Exodeoxyribonuclease V beta chain n=1 Tax=Serratia fonticola TaxID=47917 RepID=A0A4U9V3B0_SERFO|nr:Exodeoxyribonuclease V beta chain [Serratia fonticola]